MGATIAFLTNQRNSEFEAVYPPSLRARLELGIAGGDVPVYSSEDLRERRSELATVKTIFSTWNMPVLSQTEVREYFPRLTYVFYAAGSVKYFAEPYFNQGVKVYSAAAVNAIPVAEFVIAQVLLAGKGFYRARLSPSLGPFRARRMAARFSGNYGNSIGILGAGHVGQLVMSRLRQNVDCTIKVFDPYVSQDVLDEYGATRAELEEVFAECAIISNHMPDTPETRGVIDSRVLSLMRPTGTFINTGRGAQVVERDLVRTLRKNPLQTALLDVTATETVRPWSPLLWARNAYLTPHIAGSTGAEKRRLGEAMLRAYEVVVAGGSSEYEVDATSLERGA